jgi:hypothetical protein
VAGNDHLCPMPAGRARWAPRAMAPDRKSERASCAAHHPGLPRNAARPARGAARDRPGRSSRCGPVRCEVGGRRQRTQPRTDSRSCGLAVPGPCRARHARHVPEAAARQITKPDSAVHCCRDDRRSRSVAIACRKAPTRPRPGEFPRSGAVVARRLHRALHGCDVPPHGAEVEGPGLHAAHHRLEVIVCRLRTPATTSVASMGSPKRGTARHKRPAGQRAAPRRRRNPARCRPGQTQRVRRCTERRE